MHDALLVVRSRQVVPICLDKSPHQINSLWADFSRQMGTICFGQTTREDIP